MTPSARLENIDGWRLSGFPKRESFSVDIDCLDQHFGPHNAIADRDLR
jgi:hypothetical protein